MLSISFIPLPDIWVRAFVGYWPWTLSLFSSPAGRNVGRLFEITAKKLNLCGLRRENENKEDFFFHLLPRAFASLRSLAHPRDKPENPRGLPIRKSRGYSSPYSNRSVNCSFWSHKGRTGRKAVFFAHTDIA